MKRKKAIIITTLVAVILLIVGTVTVKLKSTKQEVSLDTVKRGKLQKIASITGEVISNSNFETLLNPSMKVSSVNFKEGDIVNKGDVILSYDSSDVSDQLKKARLNLEYQKELQSQASSQKSQTQTQNIPNGAQGNVPPEVINEIISSNNKTPQVNEKAQKLQVDMAENDVKSLEKKLNSFKVTSPIKGKITKLNATKGTIPAQGSLLQVNDTSNLKIRLSLSQYDSALIKKGQKASIKISGIDKSFSGEVIYVSDVAEAPSPTSTEKVILADVSINEDSSNVKIGFEAECSITLSEKNSTYISFDSIKKDKSGTYVYVVEGEKLKKRYIKTGLETDFEIEVTNGLKEGDKYVKSPSETLKEGDVVSTKEVKND
ncbi:efflux RND transporter periplasmic adaptor subunit [Clostridium cylindrosporum]|uniref:RND family efflux transporter, MFP subunit n=1 Tax=Clostridium cylindrosporum DSM 605 TaxID=1121307 RepID=A0A0J8D9Y0_CLOCY|nr:efflux RND transporter periplasmic adaptor subunit [Clostridium cylindrosporum]KMT22860.1 RND family efflux transporter, MFP subunit [Clostridium cylindrosporum DSM 605]